MKILSYHNLNYQDNIFLQTICNLMKKYPFKMFYFMDIFKNNNQIFIKDTTIIIELLNISQENLNRLFEITKVLYNNKIIIKIIYKHEFIILKFCNEFCISFFKDNKWLTIILNNILKNKNIKTYYDVFIKEKEQIVYYQYLIVYNNKYLTFNNDQQAKIADNHLPLTISLYNNRDYNLLYSYNDEQFYQNLLEKIKKE